MNPSGDMLGDLVYGGADLDILWDGDQTSDGGYILAGEISSVGAGGVDAWLVKVSSGEVSGPAFVDIGGSPYADAINAPAGAGIISGYKEGDVWEFRPTRPLYRAQSAMMLVGSLGLPVNENMTLPPFTDLGGDAPDNLFPQEYVASAYDNGITKGTTDTTFGLCKNVTRAQLITMGSSGRKGQSGHGCGAAGRMARSRGCLRPHARRQHREG